VHPQVKAGHPAGASRRNHRIAVGLLLSLIVYGSLYPLTWNLAQPQDFIYWGPLGLVDVAENVILFLPLGWLLAWRHHGRPRQLAVLVVCFLIALVVASILQWLQKYLPRTPALSDILFNMLGFAAGWLAGMISASSLNRLSRPHLDLHAADRFALVMVVLWMAAELFPFIPTLDRSSVADNVKSLWQQDLWQPRRMLLHLAVTVIATAAYLLHAIWPLQWNDRPTAMRWLPFASSLSGSIEAVVSTVAFECLCFGAIVWSAARNGGSLGGMTVTVAILALACEWTQRYLPGRTAEITSVLLALGMGWLFAALSPFRRITPGNTGD